jgi:membrane protease YdiL (CAAX protease family)
MAYDPAPGSLTDVPRPQPRAALKVLPLVVVTALGIAVPFLAAFLAQILGPILHAAAPPQGGLLPWLYAHHGLQLLLGLAAIGVVKLFVPGDYGLHWPRARSCIPSALLWGAIWGIVMTVIDYAPQLLSHTRPTLDYPLTPPNVFGWLFFEGVYVGPAEEIPFRSLLVTYLAITMPGRIRLGRLEMNSAGVIVALIFALLHAGNFASRPWPLALGQQLYAFVMGVQYAYFLEKSRSVVAPMIAHNASDGVEYALLFSWVAFG